MTDDGSLPPPPYTLSSGRRLSALVGAFWVGGCEHEAFLPDDFRHVISLASTSQFQVGASTHRVEVGMTDGDLIPPTRRLYRLAGYVLRCAAGGKTLLHCESGLNRAPFMAAIVLMLGGMPVSEAVELLRRRHDAGVLSNRVFARWLETAPHPWSASGLWHGGDAEPG